MMMMMTMTIGMMLMNECPGTKKDIVLSLSLLL